jgi:hypothetical protein
MFSPRIKRYLYILVGLGLVLAVIYVGGLSKDGTWDRLVWGAILGVALSAFSDATFGDLKQAEARTTAMLPDRTKAVQAILSAARPARDAWVNWHIFRYGAGRRDDAMHEHLRKLEAGITLRGVGWEQRPVLGTDKADRLIEAYLAALKEVTLPADGEDLHLAVTAAAERAFSELERGLYELLK